MGRRGFHVLVGVTTHGRPALTGTMQLDRSCLLDLLRNHFPPNSIVPAWNRRNRAGDVVPEATRCWKPRISRCLDLDGRLELDAQMARGQHTGHRVSDVVPWVPEKASDASQQRSGASNRGWAHSNQGGVHPSKTLGCLIQGRVRLGKPRTHPDKGRGHPDKGRVLPNKTLGRLILCPVRLGKPRTHPDKGRGHPDKGRGHPDKGRGHPDKGRTRPTKGLRQPSR